VATGAAQATTPSCGPQPARPDGYARRRPELGTLHQVVRENLRTLYAAAERGFAGTPLPDFVRRELEGYIDCGLLCRGFAVLSCSSGKCPERRLVAFSCKGRGFCPSCLGRRMAQTAANVVDPILPKSAPLRQFVLTVPFEIRARLAYDRALSGAVGRLLVDSVLGFYRRRQRDQLGVTGQSGAITVLQRTSADLRLNPHWHSVVLDGVFVPGSEPGAAPVFHPLPELSTDDVADLLQVIRVRVLRFLEKAGVIESRAELVLLDDGFAEREPALAQLAAASVSGLAPAGPELRHRSDAERERIAMRGAPGVTVSAPLSVAELGFSLHARTTASAGDERGKEQLVKYVLRPPVAQERLHLLPDELVRIELKRPFGDGTTALDMDPLSLLCRLAAAVPPPRAHVVHYAGVLGAASKLRALVVPPLPPADPSDAAGAAAAPSDDRPATHRSRYRPWAELLKRTFAIEITCPSCGGRMKLVRFVTRRASMEKLLASIGEPTDAPGLSPARDPPFFKSRVLRRRLGAEQPQRELFAE